MAKTATDTTRAPLSIAQGAEVRSEDVDLVAELLNYVAGESPVTYLAHEVPGPEDIPDATVRVALRGWWFIDGDDDELEIEARGTIDASTTIIAEFFVGGDSNSVALTSTGAYVTGTLDVSVIGTGIQAWRIEVSRSAGAGVTSTVDWLAVRAKPKAATDFADPED